MENSKWNTLDEIWRGKIGDDVAVAFLRAAIGDEDYLLRSRSYALLTKAYGEYLLDECLTVAAGEAAREWQLRALLVLARRGDSSLLPRLRPLLFQRERPLLLRGALLTVAAWGGADGLRLLAAFLCNPYPGYLKGELLADAVQTAIASYAEGARDWRSLCAADEQLRRAYAQLCPPTDGDSLWNIFPYPDYLTACAAARGYSAKEMKRALFFPQRRERP